MPTVKSSYKGLFFRQIIKSAIIVVATLLLFLIFNFIEKYVSYRISLSIKNMEILRKKAQSSKDSIVEYSSMMLSMRQMDDAKKIIVNFRGAYLDNMIAWGVKAYGISNCKIQIKPINVTAKQDENLHFAKFDYSVELECIADNETDFYQFINYLNLAVPGIFIERQILVSMSKNATEYVYSKKYDGLLKVQINLDWYFLRAK